MANQYDITLSDGNVLTTLYPLEVNGPNNRSTTRQVLESRPSYTITQIGAISPRGFVKITGNWTTRFKTGYPVSIVSSTTGNNGSYTVFADSTYDSGQNETTIELNTSLPSADPGGGKIRLNAFVIGGDLTYRLVSGVVFTVNKQYTYTASGGQTTFNADYQVGLVNVYKNGTQLTGAQFTATTETTIVLTTPATAGDQIEIYAQREYTTVSSAIGETSGSADVVKTTLIFTDPSPNNSTIPFGYIQYQINSPNTTDVNTTLKLPGKGVMNYGESIIENMVHMLEHFSATDSPDTNVAIGNDPYGQPIRGQLWHWWSNDGGRYYEAFQRYSVAPEYTGWTKDWDVDNGKLILRDPQNPNKETSGRDADVYLKGNDSDVGLRIHLSTNPDPQDSIVRITNQQDNIEYFRVEYGIAGDPGYIESANSLHISTLSQNDAEIFLNAPANTLTVFQHQTQGNIHHQTYVDDTDANHTVQIQSKGVVWDVGTLLDGDGNVLFEFKGNYTTNVGTDGIGNYELNINGTSITTVMGNVTENYLSSQTTHINNNYNLNVGYDGTGNFTFDINGTSTTDVLGNVQEIYRASQTTDVATNLTETVGVDYLQKVWGSSTVNVAGIVDELYGSNQNTTVSGDVQETYLANQTTLITNDLSTYIGDNYILNVGTDGTGNLNVDVNGTSATDVLGAVTEIYRASQTTTVTGNVTENYQSNVDTNITGNNDVDINGTNVFTSIGASTFETNGPAAHLTIQTLNNTSDIGLDSARDIIFDAASDIILTAGTSINLDNNTLYIDTVNNRVGILNDAPQYPLDVNGAARIQGRVGINQTPPVTNVPTGTDIWLAVTGDIQANSQFLGSNGTGGEPTYSFTNDTDTGVYRSAANEISFTTNGNRRVAFKENGTVGIYNLTGTQFITFGESQGAAETASDIYLRENGAICAGDSLYINVDGDNDGTGTLEIGKGACGHGDANYVPLLRVTNGGIIRTLVSDYETLITNDDDIPNKKYVDDKVFSSSWREPVKVIDTGDYPNVAAFPTGTVDGVTINTNDRVLFSGSSTNVAIRDIYVWSGSAWVKDQDTVPPGQVRSVGDVVYIQDGTAAGKVYAFDVEDEWSLISGKGGGCNVIREQHTATAGQTTFNLTHEYRPTTNGSLLIMFVNGQKQTKDLFYTEVDTQTVNVISPSPLLAGDVVEFYIFEQVTTEAVKFNRETQTGLTGNPTVTFTLISYVVNSDNLFVYLNGQKVIKDIDYTETGSTTINWIGIPLVASDVIEAYSQVPIVAGTLLEDVENVSPTTPNDGDILVYNAGLGIWEPQHYATKPLYRRYVGISSAGPWGTPGPGGNNTNLGEATLQVFVNGILQMEDEDYTVAVGSPYGTITLLNPPPAPTTFNLVIYEFGS